MRLVNNKLIVISMYALIIFNFYGFSCGASPIIHQKKKIYEANCKSKELLFQYDIWERKSRQIQTPMFLDEKGIYWVYENEKNYLDQNSDYMEVDIFTGVEDAVQLRVYCKDNGKLILDTGRVSLDTVRCDENHAWFYFLDGHAKKKEGDSCFPKGLNIEGLKKYMK